VFLFFSKVEADIKAPGLHIEEWVEPLVFQCEIFLAFLFYATQGVNKHKEIT
jgi:hypothetical protein